MDPRTLKFILFAACGLIFLAGGYLSRKRGWVSEKLSRPIHFWTVVAIWSPVSLVSLWRAPLTFGDSWLILIQIMIVLSAGLLTIPLCRRLSCTRTEIGVLAPAAALGNLGFTMGGYICYSLMSQPDKALGIAIAFVTVMQIVGIVTMYPIARRFGHMEEGDKPVWKTVVGNLFDVRSVQLYTAALGQVLGSMSVPTPDFVDQFHLIDIFFYLGSFGGYFGIGLLLRLGDAGSHLKPHVILAVMKFAYIPALTALMLFLIHLTPWPFIGIARQVVIVEAFMPTAIQSVMIANLFHTDSRLASSLWLWNTALFALVPLPLIVWWLA